MKNDNRKQILNFRTSGISDEMYAHIEEKINGRSFKDYAIELIKKEMNEESQLDKMELLFNDLKDEMVSMRAELNGKIETLEKSVHERVMRQPGETEVHVEKEQEEEDDLREGQLLNVEVETKDSIDVSEFDMDF